MKITRGVEITVGAFVALGLLALLMLAMKVGNLTELTSPDSYEVTAYFENVGGLKVRAPVNMGGVRVGRVAAIDYDTGRYQAKVTMWIEDRFAEIPTDTTASILTAGLLGEQYVGLDPGGEEAYLKDKSEITLTQSAMVLEQLIGQFLFDKAATGSETTE
jgi:phospholipid/cholesterol/gamma-HCH transport system substrate-binding protein